MKLLFSSVSITVVICLGLLFGNEAVVKACVTLASIMAGFGVVAVFAIRVKFITPSDVDHNGENLPVVPRWIDHAALLVMAAILEIVHGQTSLAATIFVMTAINSSLTSDKYK